jgi:uncharacterized protein (TIGR02284 family)
MQNETVDTLNNLIETLKDGQEGFAAAAKDVKDPNVRSTFNQFATERGQMVEELASQVRQYGEDPDTDGSATAAIHRGWMNLKSALGGGEKSILDEAERGEDQAVSDFEKALENPKLPPDVQQVVRSQYTRVKRAHDQVKMLRDSWKAAS